MEPSFLSPITSVLHSHRETGLEDWLGVTRSRGDGGRVRRQCIGRHKLITFLILLLLLLLLLLHLVQFLWLNSSSSPASRFQHRVEAFFRS